eukprot:Skav225266  [mRNA]  locus=scaffold4099:100789:101412:+ [translate_table: standard]
MIPAATVWATAVAVLLLRLAEGPGEWQMLRAFISGLRERERESEREKRREGEKEGRREGEKESRREGEKDEAIR